MPASSWNSAELWSDFIALCDCGGRRAGTPGEGRALEFLRRRLAALGGAVREEQLSYPGWRLDEAALRLPDGTALACNPLLGSQSTDSLFAEVSDLGRGTREHFERNAARIPGRIVLVRHEYPFSPEHVHRRRKLGWAVEFGAAGFLIANPHPGGGPVSGSSGRGGGAGIPAAGTDYESSVLLEKAPGPVTLKISGEDYAARTSVLTLDLPGRNAEWVVLSAHLDGHDLAESALDNASGVATVLAVARALAPEVAACERGLRVCLFSAEEWALAGSKQYLDAMPAGERSRIALNINLDTVAGDAQLTALTSEFPRLEQWAREAGLPTHAPMMANSDHYNFARHGIPAMRLVAGFARPESNVRHILTGADTRDKTNVGELQQAAQIAAALTRRALMSHDAFSTDAATA